MKLVVFGCSHSDDAELLPTPWPTRLGVRLGWDVDNYARSGLSNEVIFRTVMKYLSMNIEVDHIIVQWTELKRYSRLNRKHSMITWAPDELSLRPWYNKRLKREESHPDFGPEQEMVLIWTWCIQEACKKRGIKCNFVAYCDLGKIDISPLWSVVDQTLFLHNSFDNGWKNHCSWKFKEDAIIPESPDSFAGGHLTDKSVDYTTDCWYKYLTIGNQIHIEEENWARAKNARSEIYRYDYTEFK